MADVTDTFYAINDAIKNGYGVQLEVGDDASPDETFQAIAGIREITPGDMSTADLKRTHLRSPDAHHEHGAGLRDSGPFSIKGFWLPDDESQSNAGGGSGSFQDGGLIAIWRSRANRNFRIVLNDGSPATAWPFRGYVNKFQPGAITAETDIEFEAGIQPTEAYDADLP